MGTGRKSVQRTYTDGAYVVVGLWENNRIGTFRGIHTGAQDFGGTVFDDKGITTFGHWEGYRPPVVQIANTSVPAKPPSLHRRRWKFLLLWKQLMNARPAAELRKPGACDAKSVCRQQQKRVYRLIYICRQYLPST